MQTFRPRGGLNQLTMTMKRLAFCVAMIVATGAGCSGRSPVAPDTTEQRPAEFLTISGWVYEHVEWADPPIAQAIIEVKEADGSLKTTVTDADGFYRVSVRPGSISINASKEGYEAKTWEFPLLKDTVLNFSLILN
jgi:carboxypeptidase family protein